MKNVKDVHNTTQEMWTNGASTTNLVNTETERDVFDTIFVDVYDDDYPQKKYLAKTCSVFSCTNRGRSRARDITQQ